MTHFIDFTIQPGLNTFDTHFFVVGPVPSSFDQRLDDSGLTRDKVKTIEAKDGLQLQI